MIEKPKIGGSRFSNINRAKRTGDIAVEVERLPSNHEAPSSNPSTAYKTKTKQKESYV
jgi:hypothetical protein